MLKLRFAATPSFGVGTRQSAERVGQVRARLDLVTLVGLKIITVVSRIQPQRFDCRLIDCSRDWQVVIALEIRDSRPRIDAQRAGDWTIIVACILQRGLDVRDDFVGEQITVRVDRPIVVVIGLQWIVAISWIPVAPVQEIISSVTKTIVSQ